MLQLFTTDDSPAVTLTASHVVFTTNSTKYAGDLVPGDTLLHWDGVQMEELEITEIKTSYETGFWAPLTRAGTLLVNGFLMSCYASYPHKVSAICSAFACCRYRALGQLSRILVLDSVNYLTYSCNRYSIKQFVQVYGKKLKRLQLDRVFSHCYLKSWDGIQSQKKDFGIIFR